jgi:hypothetical protein
MGQQIQKKTEAAAKEVAATSVGMTGIVGAGAPCIASSTNILRSNLIRKEAGTKAASLQYGMSNKGNNIG